MTLASKWHWLIRRQAALLVAMIILGIAGEAFAAPKPKLAIMPLSAKRVNVDAVDILAGIILNEITNMEQPTNTTHYHLLDSKVPASADAIPPEFVMYQDERLLVAWAPVDHINTDAQLAIVGITPGWAQADIAYRSAQKSLSEGLSYTAACEVAKAQASLPISASSVPPCMSPNAVPP